MTSTDLPRPLADEIPRDRVVERLAERWARAVTLVEAPAGFGKSTALGQAIRDNESDPTGIDRYARLRRRHSDPTVFVEAVVGAAPPTTTSDPAAAAGQVVEWLAQHAPTLVCLHLDDVHEVAEIPAAVALLHELVRQLPSNGRLVLAGRRMPSLPLGRLRAADEVGEVGAADLAFTVEERIRLADHHGADAAALDRYDGWPAMTRLGLVVGGSAPADYLLEEVVARLSDPERVMLAVAALVGELDADLAVRIGLAPSVAGAADAIDALATQVPLVVPVDDHRVRVHDLWSTVVDELVEPGAREQLVRAGVDHLIEHGRPVEAVEVALAAGSWVDARQAMMVACRSDVHLSADLAEGWLARVPGTQLDEPELLYLRGIVARLRQVVGNGDDLVVQAMERFFDRGDPVGEATAAFEVGLRAWLANDVVRVLDVLGRAPRLLESGVGEMATVLTMGEAAALELQGDLAAAQRIATSADFDSVPLEFAELFMRHASTLSFLVGLGDQGLEHARRLVERNPSPRNLFVLSKAQFQCGDPSAVLDGWEEHRRLAVGHRRDDFLLAVFASMVDVSLGIAPDAARVRELSWERSREQTFVALVEAAAHIVDGDEAAAAAHLAERIAEIGPADPLALGELRRFGPYASVLLPDLGPTLMDGMGPMLRRRTDVAAALVALRNGSSIAHPPLPEPPEILTVLPLPWSVELAARLAAESDDRGTALGGYLLDTLGVRALDRFREAETSDDDRLARGAAAVLAAAPAPPSVVSRVRLCGVMQIAHGTDAPFFPNRSRARQLLALLALRRQMRRSEIVEVLWPELPADRARNNLAQTLNYVRQLLEPSRRRGEAPFHLRQESELVWLHRNPGLIVDLWEIEDRLAAAEAEIRRHRRRAAVELLVGVADRWVGPVAPDLRGFAECEVELHALDRRILDGLLVLAEWSLADDDLVDARRYAELALMAQPLDERAHGVLIGAALAQGDLAAARSAAERAVGALADVGLRPGATLRMLLRRIEVRSGSATPLRRVGG